MLYCLSMYSFWVAIFIADFSQSLFSEILFLHKLETNGLSLTFDFAMLRIVRSFALSRMMSKLLTAFRKLTRARSAPKSLFVNFQGCITVYLSRYIRCCVSAATLIEYHKRFALSTAF